MPVHIVIEHLRRGALRHPERPAFVAGRLRLSYAEVAATVERIAAGMVARHCPPGTPAAVLSPNHPHAFAAMLGILQAGAAWVPVNARNGATANAEFLARTGCEWLFWHSSLNVDAEAIRAALPTLRHLVQIDGDRIDASSMAAFLGSAGAAAPELPADPDRICTIVGTGGTTGTPKGVTWTEATWNTLLATTWAAMPCDVPPVHLCVAPMTHAAGVLAMMLMPGGATNIVMQQPDPLEIMRRIEADSVTHLYLPPTLLYLMLAHPEVRRFSYRSLRYFLITAAPVAPERLREAVAVFGPVMAQCYGQSEAPMICAFFPPAEIAAAAGDDAALSSCGRATILTRLAVMDANGALLPEGEVGEIVVQGGLVMRGYLDDPAATADASRHGWHHTGDIGRIGPDGMVFLLDRQKDMVITGGFNVYPAEIERLILSHPAVQDCAVIGVPDPKWGEAVKAVIELKPGAQATEAEIIALCRSALGGVKTPKSVEFREALPRSPVGKLLKRSIRDEYWAGRARAV